MNILRLQTTNCKDDLAIGNRSFHRKNGFVRPSMRFLSYFGCWLVVHWVNALTASIGKAEELRPNILWITSEDNGPELGCYGDTYAETPNLDRLAQQGMIYRHAWSNAPVCAPARTTIITGMWPPSLGAMHMRSEVALPKHVRLFPSYLRELGYYCCNNEKEDYNVVKPAETWDDSSRQAHWRNRKPGQPFFSVFNITVSHESQIRKRPHTAKHDPSKAPIPAYHPNTAEVRQDWAQYYDKVTEMDQEVGRILGELDADKLRSETIIVYFGDHGSGMPRSKRWLYQSGLHVPCIISVPEKWKSLAGDGYRMGQASDRLMSFLDLAPTMLSLAGSKIPEHFMGSAMLGPQASREPEYLYGFRDRMDERYDFSRAIRDRRYLYIRNGMPHRIQGQYLDYMFQTPATQSWLAVYQRGEADVIQSRFWNVKPSEELYDLEDDPEQFNNLCDDRVYSDDLGRMRRALTNWMIERRDLGWMPESEMIARSGQMSPWEMSRSNQLYPIQKVAEVADWAIEIPHEIASGQRGKVPEAESVHRAEEWLQDPEALVRYWAAMGLLVRSVRGQACDLSPLEAVVESDGSGAVRVVAAEALLRFGGEVQSYRAEKVLIELSHCEHSDFFVAMTAMNALDHSPRSILPFEKILSGLPEQDRRLPGRYGPYLRDLKRRLLDPQRWRDGAPKIAGASESK